MAADKVHFLGDLPGGALPGALKGHVLHKVRQAVFIGRFQHAACLHPRADTHGTQVRHGLRQYS